MTTGESQRPSFSLTKRCKGPVWFLYQGCGIEVETGVGVGRSRPFSPESESELESVKIGRLRLRPGVADCQRSTDDDFGRTIIHPSESIEKREENESGIVQIKL